MSFLKCFVAGLVITSLITVAVLTRGRAAPVHAAATSRPTVSAPSKSRQGGRKPVVEPSKSPSNAPGCPGLNAGIMAERTAPSRVQAAASINPTSQTDFAGCGFRSSVLNLKQEGANEVTLVVPYEQKSDTTSDIYAGPATPTRAALVSGIKFVRSVHMRVMLSFHDDLANGTWRAFINAADRTAWFARYSTILNYLGQVGEQDGVGEICLGTELYDMTSTNANAGNGPAWLQMIAKLKKVYTGELTYAGQRPGAYENETTSLSFWPEMSQIGIDAYYPLGTSCDPTVASMERDWSQINAEYFEPLVRKYHKPILFTELGFSSVNCDNLNTAYYGHGGYYPGNGIYDGVGQADLFEALFAFFSRDPNWAGISVWFWYSNPSLSAPGDLSFSPYRKPAAAVLKRGFALLADH